MSDNPLTTARINRTVYDLRHWKLTLLVWFLFLIGRFVSGRNLRGGGRTTDARFVRGARRVHGTWYNRLPGAARLGIRCAVLGLLPLWLWGGTPWLIAALVVGSALLVWVGLRQLAEERHLDRNVRPVWPAVAGIIGVDAEDNPSAWLDVPGDLDLPGAEIVVGLRAADAEDERRVAHLVTLFTQRLGVAMAATVDYAGRTVHLFRRPPEPAIWPAVADILGVPASDLAGDWLALDPGRHDDGTPRPPADFDDKKNLTATVAVRLPDDLVDDEPVTESLKVLCNQRFAGDWLVKTDRQKRRATLRRKPPEPVPPKRVDLLAEYPVPLIPAQPNHASKGAS
jgi:hypothetical protein